MYQFPKDFYGEFDLGPLKRRDAPAQDGKGDNLWDYWYRIEPNRFYQGQGPEKTSTFMNTGKKIWTLIETGHTAFRTSIQWSRIFPEGRGEINQAGVDFYRRVFEKIKEKGIHPSLVNPSIILICRWLSKSRAMVGKIRKPPMLTKNMRVFGSRPMGIWSTSGSL